MLKNFFDSKSEQWYHNGICDFPKRWTNVIKKNGDYFN